MSVDLEKTAPAGAVAQRYIPSTEKARAELGLREYTTLADAIKKTAEWAYPPCGGLLGNIPDHCSDPAGAACTPPRRARKSAAFMPCRHAPEYLPLHLASNAPNRRFLH